MGWHWQQSACDTYLENAGVVSTGDVVVGGEKDSSQAGELERVEASVELATSTHRRHQRRLPPPPASTNIHNC